MACCLTASSAIAQGHWTKLDPPTASDLSKVCFMDSVRGWVAGDSGVILKTTDGGRNWTAQTTNIDDPILDLFMLDQSFGWALALEQPQDTSRFGTILLKTTDGGNHWTNKSYGTKHLFDVCLIGTDTGIAVGADGIVLRTTDGGLLWTIQPSGTTAALQGVSFADANTGTVVGTGGAILRTTNGGITWTSQSSGILVDLLDVSFTRTNRGTAVGSGGTILRTTNGGTLWTTQPSGTAARLQGVTFADTVTGTAVGSGGTILRTINGGTTWTSQSSGTIVDLLGVSFPDRDTGTVVGTGGTILHTTNGGTTWTGQLSGTLVDLVDVSFANADTGTAVGYGGTILRTTNGGATWTSQWTGVVNLLYGVSFSGTNTGTVVGQNGRILRTTNGGIYWTAQDYPLSFFYAIFFFDSLNGLMGGDRGKIRQTTDGGLTWFPAVVDSSVIATFPVLHFDFYDRFYGFAVGGRMDLAGIVWKTTNGGARWHVVAPASEPFHALHFIDSLNLIAVGGDFDYGAGMIRSKNGGESWEYTYLNIWGEARALAFRTPSEGYSPLGFPGTYMVTMDTGRTWTLYYTLDSSGVFDVVFPDSTHGYMVGARGRVFKYDPKIVSAKDTPTELPSIPILQQNYPNPFNPVTAIRYQLPEASYVVLKVYNVIGREVKTLLKGNEDAGMHKVEFNGEGLASGTYYYELTTNIGGTRSTQVRKMILLR